MEVVFPIVKKILKSNEYQMLATGFFIDNYGFFVTTGHTFKNKKSEHGGYFACIKDSDFYKLVPIIKPKILYRRVWADMEALKHPDRNRKRHQYGPEFKDIAVGKVDLYYTPFLKFQKKKPFEWNHLELLCYNEHPENCPEGIIRTSCEEVNIDSFKYNIRKIRLMNRNQLSRVPFMGFENEHFQYKNINKYNNCFEVEGTGRRGNSGGPVLNEKGLVVGIFTGCEEDPNNPEKMKFPINIHSSKYVRKKATFLKKKIETELLNEK